MYVAYYLEICGLDSNMHDKESHFNTQFQFTVKHVSTKLLCLKWDMYTFTIKKKSAFRNSAYY